MSRKADRKSKSGKKKSEEKPATETGGKLKRTGYERELERLHVKLVKLRALVCRTQ